VRCSSRDAGALGLSLVLTLAACGLPDEEKTRTIDTAVPYNLLQPADPGADQPAAGSPLPRHVPAVLWVRGDDRLVPAAVGASCQDPPSDVVDLVLRTLVESPTTDQRDTGWSSAIPPSARLEVVAIADGVARVEVDLGDLGDPERLPFAVGQLVLSVTSAPEVDALEVVASGETAEAPLPGGALADRPLTAKDYVQLLPRRLRGPSGTGVSSKLGCR
jgi:Sporulation and spore germination